MFCFKSCALLKMTKVPRLTHFVITVSVHVTLPCRVWSPSRVASWRVHLRREIPFPCQWLACRTCSHVIFSYWHNLTFGFNFEQMCRNAVSLMYFSFKYFKTHMCISFDSRLLAAKYRPYGVYKDARSILIIHNLAHQVISLKHFSRLEYLFLWLIYGLKLFCIS